MGENMNTPRTIYDNGKYAMKEIVPMNLTDIEPVETVPEVVKPLPDNGEVSRTITLTPEQAEAFKRLAQAVCEVGKRILGIFMEWADRTSHLWENIVSRTMDELLRIANSNPKWWHLYKHAKKYRTRKKYRRLLMKQLSKLRAANVQEAEA